MNRTRLIEQLKCYREQFVDEQEMVSRFIDFVSSHENCFERTLTVGHVTGSAWVVNQSGTHVLLTHHKKLNRWLQLGGHADGDTDVLRVARREVREESGLSPTPLSGDIFDVDIHLIPERKNEAAHFHYDLRYLMQTDTDTDYVVSDESHDLAWIALDDLTTYSTEPSMLRMAAKWRAMCGL